MRRISGDGFGEPGEGCPVAGGHEDQAGEAGDGVEQEGQDLGGGRIEPLKVIDKDAAGLGIGGGGEVAGEQGDGALAELLGREIGGGVGEVEQAGQDGGGVWVRVGDGVGGRLGVEQVDEGAEGRVRIEGGTADFDEGCFGGQVILDELADEAGFADAGLAGDEEGLGLAWGGFVPEGLDGLELRLTADEGGGWVAGELG